MAKLALAPLIVTWLPSGLMWTASPSYLLGSATSVDLPSVKFRELPRYLGHVGT